MDTVSTPVRLLVRLARRNPGLVLIAVLTLGLGIGASTAIFSVVDAVLIRPLPYEDPDRLVKVGHTAPGIGLPRFDLSDGTWWLYSRHGRVLESLGTYRRSPVTLLGGREPERITAAEISASTLSLLRVDPALGRPLQEADERPGAEKVVLLSHELWQSRFGGAAGAVGSTLQIDGAERRVIGVMRPDFHFPSPDVRLWLPLPVDPARLTPASFNYEAVGRLRAGATAAQAARELSALVWRIPELPTQQRIPRGMIEQAQLAVVVQPLRDDMVGAVERILWVLLGSVGILLMIACANVANLFLLRAEGREREVAVRMALGATRREVARLFLAESFSLALAGGALGLALAAAGVRLLVRLRPEGIPRLEEIGAPNPVLGGALLLSLAAGGLTGLLAVLRYRAPAPGPALSGAGGTAGRMRHGARKALVVVQVGLALVLLVGAVLMVKSFRSLRRVDPGVDPTGVLTLRLSLPAVEYPDVESAARFIRQLLERARAIPGVASAGTVTVLPLTGNIEKSGYRFEDFPLPAETVPHILSTRFASPGYFEAMRIPLLQGRVFYPGDLTRHSGDVVVSEAVAKRFWPRGSALGRRLSPGNPRDGWYTIVGVVGDVREAGLREAASEAVYFPVLRLEEPAESGPEYVPRDFNLVVRQDPQEGGDPRALVAPVREAVRSLDPNLPVALVRTMEEVVEQSLARVAFTMLLLVLGAALAFVLGIVGLYGAVSYIITQRTQEIGVRMALGASRRDIVRLVLRDGLALALAGVVLGLVGAFAVTRLMRAFLYDVSPTDLGAFVLVPLALVAVALLASYLPARRAAAVEPHAAIRSG